MLSTLPVTPNVSCTEVSITADMPPQVFLLQEGLIHEFLKVLLPPAATLATLIIVFLIIVF